jgi:hypothetical protein
VSGPSSPAAPAIRRWRPNAEAAPGSRRDGPLGALQLRLILGMRPRHSPTATRSQCRGLRPAIETRRHVSPLGRAFRRRRRLRSGSSGFVPQPPRRSCALAPPSVPGNHRCAPPFRVRAAPDCRVGEPLLPACRPRGPSSRSCEPQRYDGALQPGWRCVTRLWDRGTGARRNPCKRALTSRMRPKRGPDSGNAPSPPGPPKEKGPVSGTFARAL